MKRTVFYAWQSDSPEETNRYFIRDVVKAAIKELNKEIEVAMRLDHDTKDVTGMPDIPATIKKKIQECSVFLADLTYVAKTDAGKVVSNPNVLFELGFVFGKLGWEKLICVLNTAYGKPDEQIFDLRHHRFPICYNLKEYNDPERKQIQKKLTQDIKGALKEILKEGVFPIKLGFSGQNFSQHITLPSTKCDLPSAKVITEIKEIIERKKKMPQRVSTNQLVKGLNTMRNPFAFVPYENRSIDELKTALKNVKKDYKEDDIYQVSEVCSHKINLEILSKADKYIEDATIRLQVPKMKGLLVIKKIVKKPKHSGPLDIPIYDFPNFFPSYPSVDETETEFIIEDHIGDIKHHRTMEVFKEPIRLVLHDSVAGETINIKCQIFCKNLPDPLSYKLKIKVEDASD